MFINELIFRDRKEFNKFLEKHTTDGKYIDISSFTDMPECVKKLTVDDDGLTLDAATFFVMEELDVEMRPLVKEEIMNYISEKKLKKCYQRFTPEDIIYCSKKYSIIWDSMNNRGFSFEAFYEYGRNAFESLICYNSANYHRWIRNSFGPLPELYYMKIDKEAMKISWKSVGKSCNLLISHSKAEVYYRAADELDLSTASEMWIAGHNKRCVSSYDVDYNIVFGSKHTDILDAFLSGKMIDKLTTLHA